MYRILLFLFLTIFLFMPITSWGGLQKSATDDETIEQAISRIVQDHNADPTAHGSAGEALDLHKTNEVIDHPAYSVVKDKLEKAMTDALLFYEDGRGKSGWLISQIGTNEEVNFSQFEMAMHSEDSAPASRADANLIFNGYYQNFASEEMYLEFRADFSNSPGLDCWVSIGFGLLWSSWESMGFMYDHVSGHVKAYKQVGGVKTYIDMGAPVPDEAHKYRVQYSPTSIDYYYDDVLVGSFTSGLPTGAESSIISMGIKSRTGYSGTLHVRALQYSQSSTMQPN